MRAKKGHLVSPLYFQKYTVNKVNHTGANGFTRLARQALFDGKVMDGQHFVIVDDFVGMGGTIANLKDYIESKGGIVVGATTLKVKPYPAKIALNRNTLKDLRDKNGKELEKWWEHKFGHTFDCLTRPRGCSNDSLCFFH